MRTTPDLPEVELSERDGRYLRKAIVWSHLGARRGNQPYGAVIVSLTGEVLGEACNTVAEADDCTAHAEMNAIRSMAHRGIVRERLAESTLYASAEPCLMCAGAIRWSGIGRVVFGIDATRLARLRAELANAPDEVALSGGDALRTAPAAVECIGPAFVEEAAAAHVAAQRPAAN
ncbi:MAG: nucleoside deaminase [Comamonadaceae bacterium]|nr:MAG: nucleoside deaminase [Comamonadaceae bacterium]